jgi:hypothetical protein
LPEIALVEWQEDRHRDFLAEVRAAKLQWPTDLAGNHYQLSFALRQTALTELTPAEILAAAKTTNFDVRDFVWTGWSMFHPFTREPIRPHVIAEQVADDVAPDGPSFITGLCSPCGPLWTGLQTRSG